MRIIRKVAIFSLVSLITFGLGVTVRRSGSATWHYFSEPSGWQVLLKFENQDLAGLDEQSMRTVECAITKTTGAAQQTQGLLFVPRIFRKISNSDGTLHYILVEESPLVIIPGEETVRVHIFDTAGIILSRAQFSTGNRRAIRSMQIRKNYGVKPEALILDVESWLGGYDSRHFYAVIGHELRLVYLYDTQPYCDQGSRFHIYNGTYTTGPRVNLSADQWETELQSTDESRVLSALTWLAGHHWGADAVLNDPEDQSDSAKDINLRARDSVRRRLADLTNSENFFIKSTAEAVLNDK